MSVTTEAHDAWWPPTLSPSRLGRRWLAWWIVQALSQSTLRSSSRSMRRRCTGAIVVMAMAYADRGWKVLAFRPAKRLYKVNSSSIRRLTQ